MDSRHDFYTGERQAHHNAVLLAVGVLGRVNHGERCAEALCHGRDVVSDAVPLQLLRPEAQRAVLVVDPDLPHERETGIR